TNRIAGFIRMLWPEGMPCFRYRTRESEWIRRRASAFSSHSLPPRTKAKPPEWGWQRCTGLSNNTADLFTSTASQDKAAFSAFTFQLWKERRRRVRGPERRLL